MNNTRPSLSSISAIRQFTQNKMAEHNLCWPDWEFGWNNRTSSLGICYSPQLSPAGLVTRPGRIELSRNFVENNLQSNQQAIFDVIMHEIAHGIVGTANKHNDTWKAAALKLGAIPRACSQYNVKIKYKYRANCRVCNKQYVMQKPLSKRRYYCNNAGCPVKERGHFSRQLIWIPNK